LKIWKTNKLSKSDKDSDEHSANTIENKEIKDSLNENNEIKNLFMDSEERWKKLQK